MRNRNIGIWGAIPLVVGLYSTSAVAIPYTVSMDDVDNLANWATIDDGIGDLYDGAGVKQIEVSYTERVNFGNSAVGDPDPQFWNSLEYGDNHRALFSNAGGTEVLEVEITGLNGNLIDLSQILVGRWFPDGINTLASDWWVYDGDWNLLVMGTTEMTDFIDYFLDFDLGEFETVRFQLGEDNWDNGLIAFSYNTDVVGTLDLRLDRIDDPTPDILGSGPGPGLGAGPVAVPAPATLALFGLGLAGLGFARRKKV